MISIRFVKFAVSGLAIGMALSGGHASPGARAESQSDSHQAQMAATAAAKATAALQAQNYRIAVSQAEAAVSFRPRDANYRMLLAQSYLGAGRFASSETSFADTLALSPDNARAALHLALTEIALGKRDAAMSTLADYRDRIAASDYGLALALAGDVDAATKTLESSIRTGNSDAKTRQNLALTYALAGNWENARIMASQDLAPDDVNNRIGQWASFVRPASSFDQVASLLGVTPGKDAGQPERLALNRITDTAVAMAEAAPVQAIAPVPVPAPAPAVEPVAVQAAPVAETVPAPFETAGPVAPVVAMNDRHEIVQPVPEAPLIRAPVTNVRQVVVPKAKPSPAFVAAVTRNKTTRGVESGKFVVQLGAFQNAAVSRDAWRRMSTRYALTNFDPANSAARVGGANYIRLSIGGFSTRAEATGVCTRVRDAGGTCFVRGVLGDAPAMWVQRGMPKAAKLVRIAAR